jgi:hypothetical protein
MKFVADPIVKSSREILIAKIEECLVWSVVQVNYAYKNSTPLILAVKNNDIEKVEYFLKTNADPNFKPSFINNYPLHTACINYASDIIKLLLQYNADPNLLNNQGKSPKTVTLERHQFDLACTANIKDNLDLRTILQTYKNYPQESFAQVLEYLSLAGVSMDTNEYNYVLHSGESSDYIKGCWTNY